MDNGPSLLVLSLNFNEIKLCYFDIPVTKWTKLSSPTPLRLKFVSKYFISVFILFSNVYFENILLVISE